MVYTNGPFHRRPVVSPRKGPVMRKSSHVVTLLCRYYIPRGDRQYSWFQPGNPIPSRACALQTGRGTPRVWSPAVPLTEVTAGLSWWSPSWAWQSSTSIWWRSRCSTSNLETSSRNPRQRLGWSSLSTIRSFMQLVSYVALLCLLELSHCPPGDPLQWRHNEGDGISNH